MYTSTLLSVVLAATLAAAAPLELGYDSLPESGDVHAATLEKAKNDANTQIQNMRATLANPDDPVNKQRILDAFGPQANIAEISKTVEKLHTGTLQVATADPALADAEKGRPALAKVSLNKNADGTFDSMGSAKIGSRFHKSTFSDKQRAGTLIHEATHQLARTGDDVITQGMGKNIIVPAGVKPAGPAAIGINKEGGYARQDTAQINSAADLSSEYKALRDASPNMHQNADSYRVFGALCSRSLYKRALSQEDPVEYYLARRSECKLPPDYFAKKAAAKKAAAAKTAVGASKDPAKTTGANAKTGTKATIPKGSKGLKAQKAGKGAKSAKGTKGLNAVKGQRAARVGKGAKTIKGAKSLKTAKGRKAVKGAKAAKSLKATKGAKTAKGLKSVKGAKTNKGAKAVKGAKSLKAAKGRKAVKGAKAAKALKATKGTRTAKGLKSAKGTKAGKVGKVAKGLKTTKNTRAGKATKAGKAGKVTKATRGKATGARKVGTKATKATKGRTTTKAATKSASRKTTKAAPQVARAAPKAKLSSPKKSGKKTRRDLESILDELD